MRGHVDGKFLKSFEVTRIKCLIEYRGQNKHNKMSPTYPKDTNEPYLPQRHK
jgi:hypothetical protein